jgi:hypothetical protein
MNEKRKNYKKSHYGRIKRTSCTEKREKESDQEKDAK